jgi:pseudouridine synthase
VNFLGATCLKTKSRSNGTHAIFLDVGPSNREVSDQDLATLASGVVITTVAQRDRTWKPLTAPTLPCKVERLDDRTLTMILQEGRNRQIRKMMEALGYRVVDLHRESVTSI